MFQRLFFKKENSFHGVQGFRTLVRVQNRGKRKDLLVLSNMIHNLGKRAINTSKRCYHIALFPRLLELRSNSRSSNFSCVIGKKACGVERSEDSTFSHGFCKKALFELGSGEPQSPRLTRLSYPSHLLII